MKAKLQIIISMAIFGTIGMFVKNIPLPSGETALFRAVIAVAAILLYQLISGRLVRLADIKQELGLLFFSGVALGVNWILFFEAYRHTSVAIATLSYYFAPVLVMLAGSLIFKEKLTLKQIACFVMSTVGLMLIIGVGGVGGANDGIGILFGLGAAVLYATVVILNKFIKNVAGLNRTLLQFVAAIVVLAPYVLATGGFQIGSVDSAGYLNLFIVGIIHTCIPYCLYFTAIKDVKGQEAAILSYIDPFIAVIVSVAILGETVSGVQMLGGAMVLGFTLWNEISFKKERNGTPLIKQEEQ